MSRVYVMSESPEQAVRDGKIKGLSLAKSKDTDPVWPFGVTDGTNYGWFEGNMILFWGANDETKILDPLRKKGFRVLECF